MFNITEADQNKAKKTKQTKKKEIRRVSDTSGTMLSAPTFKL